MLVIISGPSGVGKDSIARGVIGEIPWLEISRSWTTRPPRPTETDESYNFVSREEFLKAVAQDRFLEWAEYLGNLYGTPIPHEDDSAILVIEVLGALQVKALRPEAVWIIIVPPNLDELARRIKDRGTETPEQQAARLEGGKDEVRIAINSRLVDRAVINDDLALAIGQVTRYILGRVAASGLT
ncbi:MAG TPA: guanylate kinase [Candidatus Nanoarchaeia archaeon]|nr:guanylate kinase [Candidatus Nanoarchaeia archaeon]